MRSLFTAFIALLLYCGLSRSVFADQSAAPVAHVPVYDESANATKDVADAVRIAGFENQRIVLDIGGNWCHWCTLLHDVFIQDKDVATLIRSEYRVVNIDIGNGDKNQALLATYGIKPKGYPYLAILGPDNKLLTQQETGILEDGPRHDPKKVLAFLNQWKPTPLDTNKVVSDALADAGAHGKRVFLHIGAPWCGWCHKLEDVLYQPAVTEAISSDFVLTKLDTDRMTHAADVVKKYQTSGGIPWYAVVTPQGEVVSTSDLTPGKNIGFPTEPAEIDHVLHMFTDGRQRMTDGQVAALRDAFTKAAAAVSAAGH